MVFKVGDRVVFNEPPFKGAQGTIITVSGPDPLDLIRTEWDNPDRGLNNTGYYAKRLKLLEVLTPLEESVRAYIQSELSQ